MIWEGLASFTIRAATLTQSPNHVLSLLQHGNRIAGRYGSEALPGYRFLHLHARLHLGSGLGRPRSGREHAQDLVADRLDHSPSATERRFAHDIEAEPDALERCVRAELLEQARAPGDCRRQNGEISGFLSIGQVRPSWRRKV